MPPTPTNPTTSARNRLAALLAHHADVAAAALRADARTGLPEYRSGMDRAVELLDLHAAHLTADEETPAVRELLDSILAFEAERPDLAHARQVLGTTEAEPPLSPYYSHEACGFHWHGRDGMDIPMRDGQPVCPRCELRRLAAEAQQPTPAEETTP